MTRGKTNSQGTSSSILSTSSPLHALLLDLNDAFPQLIRDGSFSPDAILQLNGIAAESTGSRFGLVWPGRNLAETLISRASVGTLSPDEDDRTGNGSNASHSFCIGDNLEVMKLLQKAYFGRFKAIYFDPPYNIGFDAVYEDDYEDPLGGYLQQYGGEPARSPSPPIQSLGKHSKWLNMMLPRLFTARNLLREDGVIFVSIDDHEVQHLRILMDEIFGEENFVCTFIWEKRYAPAPDAPGVGYVHENILCYRRTDDFFPSLLPMTEIQKGRYRNPDKDPRGPWKPADYTCRFTSRQRPTLYYAVTNPHTKKEVFPKKTRVWACSKDEHLKNVAEKRIWWPEGATVPAKKKFLNEIRQGAMPKTLLTHKEVGHTDEATKELLRWFPNLKASPKPTRLLRHLIKFSGAKPGDFVLDMLARVGTLGEAVAIENKSGAGLRAVLIQHPEKVSPTSKQTYSEVALKRTIGAMKENAVKDRGVRVVTLSRSAFKQWHADSVSTSTEIEAQLKTFVNTLMPGVKKSDILAELFLRSGSELTDRFVRSKSGPGDTYISEDGGVVVCLKDTLSVDGISQLLSLKPDRVICLESAVPSDELRLNSIRLAKTADIEFVTV